MRSPRVPSRTRLTVALTGALLLGVCACGSQGTGTGTGAASTSPSAITGTPATGLGVGALGPVGLTVTEGTDAGSAEGRSLDVPPGWTAEVWADVPGARLAAWAPDGSLVVSTGDRGVVTRLRSASDGSAPVSSLLLDELDDPQGVAFADRNGRAVLVVGEDTRIVSWDYTDGTVSNRRVLVDGLPSSGHGRKAVTVRGDTVFYSLGSSGNREPADRTEDPQRATLWQVRLDGTGNGVVATGVRNGFGLDVAPDGTLFVAVNQSDNQPYPFRDDDGAYERLVREYVDENPIEQVSRVTPGTELGWPLCVPDTRGGGVTEVPYVNDPVTNANGQELDCAGIPDTMVGLPAHSAPLGLEFTAGTALEPVLGSGALITAHGSWNREPPRPPFVAFSRWDDATATLGAPVELVTGFQLDDGSRWGRAVTSVPGPDGSLYVTDDEAGLVYRLTPGGE
ncbi:PQQ-dependent sugar dehydrogenase [Rhodococcus triatomae]|nr:glucose/sorbosone dehydrogenase [Rhodococcus triatomae BKS 15-14]